MLVQARAYIDHLEDGYLPVVRKAFEWLELSATLKYGDKVCIKPNLTFPTFRPGVMTNPDALKAVVLCLKDLTNNITICESDSGGYNQFSMDEVFQKTGILDLARRCGVTVVNMSHVPSRVIPLRCGFRRLDIPLAAFLLDDTNFFITMPVPKMHTNTVVSIALKNQWDLIQSPTIRLRLHPYFTDVIYAINKSLPKAIAVVDGKFGLTRNGPLLGDVIPLNWLLAGDNIFYVDRLVTELMGIDYRTIPYLKRILEREAIASPADVKLNTDYQLFRRNGFFLRREWTDYPGIFTFNSRLLAYIGYESFLAKPLHWLLYKFRTPFY